MAVTKAYKVHGWNGHRQRESFNKSCTYDFSNEQNGIRLITVFNADVTGTNDYSIVIITRRTAKECDEEMRGQKSDGIFENCRNGKTEVINLPRFN